MYYLRIPVKTNYKKRKLKKNRPKNVKTDNVARNNTSPFFVQKLIFYKNVPNDAQMMEFDIKNSKNLPIFRNRNFSFQIQS